MTKKSIFLVIFFFVFVMGHRIALADIYDVPKISTLQKKNYVYTNEISLQGGYLPMDPYNKYIGVGGTYTHFFSDFTAWEMVNGNASLVLPAGLRKDLEENFGALPSTFEVLNGYVTTNLVLTPIYTKNLLFNSKIVYAETSFVAGAGVALFSTGIKPVIDVGIVLRYFISKSISLRVDFRDYIYMSAARNNLGLVLGFAYNFGTKNDKQDFSDFER